MSRARIAAYAAAQQVKPNEPLHEEAGARPRRRVAHKGDGKGRKPTNHHKAAQQPAQRSVKLRPLSDDDHDGCQEQRQSGRHHVGRKDDWCAAGEFEHFIGQRDDARSRPDRDEADRHNEDDDDEKHCDADNA